MKGFIAREFFHDLGRCSISEISVTDGNEIRILSISILIVL